MAPGPGVLPSTSAISREKYIEYFEPEFAAGNDIFYVHFSRAMTATFDVMDLAVKDLREKYPERKFYAFDTKGITIVSLNLVLEIGDLFLAGKSPEEVLDWAKAEVDHFAVYFFADDLYSHRVILPTPTRRRSRKRSSAPCGKNTARG